MLVAYGRLDGRPDAGGAERAQAKDTSDAWLYERDVVQHQRDDFDGLRSVAQLATLPDWLGRLDQPAEETRAEIQQAILANYHVRRAAAVMRRWSDLGMRDRRRITHEQIETDYDLRNLRTCHTCALVYPLPPDGESFASRCDYCFGTVLEWPDRTTVSTLAERLNAIRAAAR